MNKSPVYEQILDVAEALIQNKGYNAFSYRDITEQVKIKTSSIHYYFPTKTDLGVAVVKKHLDALSAILEPLIHDKKLRSSTKLAMFIDLLVEKTFGDNEKMCLGGMLASDALTLPEALQKEVQHFFLRISNWFKQLLTQGHTTKEFNLDKDNIQAETTFIICLFEGSLLLARLYKDSGYLAAARMQILARLKMD